MSIKSREYVVEEEDLRLRVDSSGEGDSSLESERTRRSQRN